MAMLKICLSYFSKAITIYKQIGKNVSVLREVIPMLSIKLIVTYNKHVNYARNYSLVSKHTAIVKKGCRF